MTEDELADSLSTLLVDVIEESSMQSTASLEQASSFNLLERYLPETIDADVFINDIVGFDTCVADTKKTGHNSSSRPPNSGTAAQQAWTLPCTVYWLTYIYDALKW